jgi:hypothetical protein
MDGQHQYEISLKKDGLFINLSSDDVYFISKQMDKWFRILLDDSYVPVTLPFRSQAPVMQPTAPAQPEPPAAPIDSPVAMPQAQQAPPPIQPAQPIQPIQPSIPQVMEPAPTCAAAAPQPQTEPLPVMTPEMIPNALPQALQAGYAPPQDIPPAMIMTPEAPPMSVVAPAAPVMPPVPQLADVNLPLATPTGNGVVSAPQLVLPQPSAIPATTPQAVGTQAQAEPANANDFEAVMDSVMKDLDADFEADVLPESMSRLEEATPFLRGPRLDTNGHGERQRPNREPRGLRPQPDLDAPMGVPVASTMNLQEPSDLQMVMSLSDLCERSRADGVDEYLLLSSYYLTHYEQQHMFSLKRLNSVLVKSGMTPVNHSVLETALTQGYLAMVPDLTGTAEVSEYKITPQGEEAARQLI